jgi:hypothetical protein
LELKSGLPLKEGQAVRVLLLTDTPESVEDRVLRRLRLMSTRPSPLSADNDVINPARK